MLLNRSCCLPLVLLMLIVGGCAPTRYAWSPDGKRMTVLADDGLHLADTSGNLLPTFLPTVRTATWFPDSRRLVLVRDVPTGSWADLAPLYPPGRLQQIQRAAEHARVAAFEYEWDAPDALNTDRFLAFVKQRSAEARLDSNVYDDLAIPIGIYFKDHRDPDINAVIPAQWWKQLDDLRQPVHHVEVYTIDNDRLTLSATLMATLADGVESRPSPDGHNVLLVTAAGDDICDLWVAPADGHQPASKVAANAALFPDWSPNGTSIVYIAQSHPGQTGERQPAELCSIDVANSDASLRPRFDSPNKLAAVTYAAFARVRCLHDGRIFFATIGSDPGDDPQRYQLFVLDAPGGNVQPALSNQAVEQAGDAAEYFEPNPSGTLLSIPDSSGKVSVAELSSGQVRIAQAKPLSADANEAGLLSVPQWRNDDELTTVAPEANSQPAVLSWSWKTQKTVPLSATWPAKLLPSKG